MFLILNNQRIKVSVANSFYKRLTGFMGKKNINSGLIFKHCNSIHTFFMKENIDIVAINRNKEVIFKIENLEKNKIINVKNPIKNTSIIELPKYTSKSIKIGDYLTFVRE